MTEFATEPVELPGELSRLSNLIDEKLETFNAGDHDIQSAALDATKFVFDLALRTEPRSQPYISELLESIKPSQAPQTRAQARAASERGEHPSDEVSNAILLPTPLSSLFVENMDDDQVWAQLELKVQNVCKTLEDAFDATGTKAEKLLEESDSEEEEEEEEEEESDELEGIDDLDFEGMEMDDEESWGHPGESDDEGEGFEESEDDEDGMEGIAELRDPSSDDEEDGVDFGATPVRNGRPKEKLKSRGNSQLDDGFFNLASFNAEVEEAEARHVSRGSLSKGSDEDESEDDTAINFFAPIDATVAFEEADEEASEPTYGDFFEPPPKASSKTHRSSASIQTNTKPSKVRFNGDVRVKQIAGTAQRHSHSVHGYKLHGDEDDRLDESDPFQDDDDEISRQDSDSEQSEAPTDEGRETIERLKDDLFAEEEAPQTDLSTFETRMLSLKDQIASLEAENVGSKDWTMMGEASSRSRPQNALLEEALEFDRVMKSVPVVTEDVVHKLEDRIKARIVEGRFDDVVQKRQMDDKPFLPSRFFELQDKKSTQSLAQIYEDEFVAAQSGVALGDDRDGKLKQEHEEIEKMWENISGKLDALCNAHFTPKQPKATISTVKNISTIAIESALPTSKSASAVVAPEEIYATASSDVRARSELTPAEKRALRSKERKTRKKQRDTLEKGMDKFARMNGVKRVKSQKEAALKSIVKTGKGVTVIGKASQTGRKDRRKGKR